ncbi:MAG: AMP-binding protein [Parvularculales bacterium]
MHPSIHARTAPDKPAYIMAGSGEVITYKQLDERSNQLAQLFRDRGLKPGDHMALFMENNARFMEICWAAQRSGLYYTAISSRLTAGEAGYIVGDCGAKLFITSTAMMPMAEELPPLMSGVEHFLAVTSRTGDSTPKGFEAYEPARDAMPGTPIADQMRGAAMLYSSGTTGRPKGVKHPITGEAIDEPSILINLVSLLYGLNDETVYLSPAPLYHAAPLAFSMSLQHLGATCVVMEQFDPEEALKLIERYKVTASQWVPTMFVRMLKMPEEVRTRYDLSSHQCAIHAAAPCPPPIKRQMIDWWGPIINEYYAGTEGNGFCAINSEEWLAHEGSVGKALNAIVHICADDSGEELPVGEQGVIYFESETEFEYHNSPEKTAESRHPKGWTTLGDIGRVDEDGYLYLTDRKAYMIISGGVNIYPQEAENVMITHEAVTDVAVIGVPNDDFGEEVKAVVQPADWSQAGPDLEAELIDYCKQSLSAIKCPRSIDFEKELPRHATGKLYKRLIRDRYWGKHDSKIV